MSTDNKKISFQEFKAWLQGVEEMQDEGWTPTAVQWKKIKDKLEQIDFSITRPTQQSYEQPINIAFQPPASRMQDTMPPPPMPPGGRLSNPASVPETMEHEAFVSRAIPRDTNKPGYSTPFR